METRVQSVLLVPDPISHNLLIISTVNLLHQGQSLASSDCWKARALLPTPVLDALLLMGGKNSHIRPTYYLQRVPAPEGEIETTLQAVIELIRQQMDEDVVVWQGAIGAAMATGLSYNVLTCLTAHPAEA